MQLKCCGHIEWPSKSRSMVRFQDAFFLHRPMRRRFSGGRFALSPGGFWTVVLLYDKRFRLALVYSELINHVLDRQ
jgi:hypothetical protein